MGAHLCQVQAAHLRKGTLVFAAAQPAKIEGIGEGIGHLIERTIDGHQPQAASYGPSGPLRCHWVANALEQMAHDGRPQLTAAIDQRGCRW